MMAAVDMIELQEERVSKSKGMVWDGIGCERSRSWGCPSYCSTGVVKPRSRTLDQSLYEDEVYTVEIHASGHCDYMVSFIAIMR
jgi:hypothetical protein